MVKQKQFLWESVNNEIIAKKMWDELCNFDIEIESNSDIIIISNDRLRQDNNNNGIVSLKSSKYLCCINARMEVYNKEKDNCDLSSSQNNHVYLTQCLAFAHANNNFKVKCQSILRMTKIVNIAKQVLKRMKDVWLNQVQIIYTNTACILVLHIIIHNHY